LPAMRRRTPTSPGQLRLPLGGEVTEPGGSLPAVPPAATPPTDSAPLVGEPSRVELDPLTARISDLTPPFLAFSAAIDRSAYTLDALRLDLSLLVRFLGDRVAAELSLDDLRRYVAWLSRERQNDSRSLRRKVASVKAFFSYLRESRFRSDDPAEALIYPTLEPHVPEVLEVDEETRLIAAAERPLWRALLVVLLDTGLKRDEVLALHPSDISLDPEKPSRGYLAVRATDQARRLRPRTLRLTARAAAELGNLLGASDARIFAFSVRAVNFIVETCAQRAGLRKRGTVSPQMLRDTYALREVRWRVAVEAERRLSGGSTNDLAALRQRHDAEVCDLLGLTPGETNDPIARYRVLCLDA
jgi:site-specific recombinase XerD